jgi:hypothetical protein
MSGKVTTYLVIGLAIVAGLIVRGFIKTTA